MEKLEAAPAIATEGLSSTVVLNEHIQPGKSSVLNAVDDSALAGVLAPQSPGLLASDSDEQLLIYVPFMEAVKLKSIRILANEGSGSAQGEDSSGPMTIKLWVDKPNMDFSDAENLEPAQTVTFTKEQVENGSDVKVKFVKFQNVHSLTVFIEGNQDEVECTFLNSLLFTGTVRAGTNMKELKKVG